MKKLVSWGGHARNIPIAVAAFVNVGFAMVAHADTPDAGIYDKYDLGRFLCNVIDFIFWIIIVVSVIMILLAAFQYVTAGDDTEKTTRGRKMLQYAAIGIVVALLAKGFPQIVASIFPSANGSVSLGSNCAPF